MTSDEIRETFLSFFERKAHRRLASASLVPAAYDASVLLTTAGMHPLKPYFQGLETPPDVRLTSCQKCFRTPDIDNVGVTARHLTFFEMLGNFSIGDYFKDGATEFAWELSTTGFGFAPQDLWVTVFEGDDELGLGPDEEAIAAWEALGVPRERIVLCPASENFWQSGPTGPCGPCSELYIDRGLQWGSEDDLPGGENERFLEYWNLVFMQYDQSRDGAGRPVLTPLPSRNIDTGLGLNRMAVIQQGVDTVFDTDQFAPLMALGASLSGSRGEFASQTRAPGEEDRALRREPTTGRKSAEQTSKPGSEGAERALRILADHLRGATFLIADGVVPSNEDRGYVLRRLMRRAITRGHQLGFEHGFLPRYVDVVTETMGSAYPELGREHDTIVRWMRSEEEGFRRTLEHGLKMLDEVLARGEVTGEEAFTLHDTHGFPIDLTAEIAAERGAPVDHAGFEALMDAQRERSSAGAQATGRVGATQELVRDVTPAQSEFTGYGSLDEDTTVLGALTRDGRTVVKLAASPFYAQGGGQVSDSGVLTVGDRELAVVEVLRSGEDQAVVVDGPAPDAGARVHAHVDRRARVATQANHTATHLLHAALRERLGTHVRQAGSYVGPDKLRFDFTHGERLSGDELRAVEDRVNEWILAADPVRPITTTLDEARALGAMALFGEKYGEIVRMVQIGDGSYSRELCGGTHTRSTAEVGVFSILSEGSSASNVRRIEAVTGAAAVARLRGASSTLAEIAASLRVGPDGVAERIAKLREQAVRAETPPVAAGAELDIDALAAAAEQVAGIAVLCTRADGVAGKALPELADRLKGRIGDGVVVLGSAADGKAALLVAAGPAAVAGGVKAGEVVKAAAPLIGGGGGGRDTMAQAGGREPQRLDDALAAARSAITAALTG